MKFELNSFGTLHFRLFLMPTWGRGNGRMGVLLKLIARHFVDHNNELNKNNLCEEHYKFRVGYGSVGVSNFHQGIHSCHSGMVDSL